LHSWRNKRWVVQYEHEKLEDFIEGIRMVIKTERDTVYA